MRPTTDSAAAETDGSAIERHWSAYSDPREMQVFFALTGKDLAGAIAIICFAVALTIH